MSKHFNTKPKDYDKRSATAIFQRKDLDETQLQQLEKMLDFAILGCVS